MKYLSLFSGIGGFEKGIQQSHPDWECMGYSEIDKYAVQVYEKHFKHKNYGDITELNTAELPDFDLLVGGFPCQAFSIAGKRRGFDEARGTLFFEIARILRDKRPRYFVLENVKGLLSHNSGKTLQTIFRILTDLGYEFEWQVLNSKNFGVPQNRERIFIVGHLRGERRPKIFPITGYSQPTATVAGYISEEDWPRRHEQTKRVYKIDGAMPTIPTGTGGGVMTKIAIPILTPDRINKRQNGRRFKKDGDPAFTLTGQDRHGIYKDSLLFEIKVIGNIYPSGGENGDVLDVGGISKTLKSGVTDNPNSGGGGSSNSPKIMQDYKIRRLTPTECERLQGFPDNWTDILSDTQRYKTLGNAVTVNVIKTIFERF